MLDVAKARLATLAASVPEVDIGTEVGTGTVHGGILEAAERVAADLIVLSSHRPSVADYLLGANASRVVRHAKCSVLVVRGSMPGADLSISAAAPAEPRETSP
jgi:nucleotide-binding universal stress UspA family protein